MCEFKVKLGEKTIAEEILVFHYSPEGREARFADVLGRSTPAKDILVTGVNMLPGRHEITLLQSPAAGKSVELLLALANKNAPAFNRSKIEQLLKELTEIVKKELK